MTSMKLFHWFWAWDDEKEETWLRELANQGWHFQSVAFPGSYTFNKGEPKDLVYRLDYFIESKDKQNYLQIFLDAGWEYLGEMKGWQYFCKEGLDGEAPEIYSDQESKAYKYQRILLILIILLPIFITSMISLTKNNHPLANAFSVFMAVIMAFFTYAMIRLLRRITTLKKQL